MKNNAGSALRKRIRTAALRLFSTRGLENTSVRDIVRAARTTQPMLYYYFNSKEDLYLDIYGQFSKRILGRVRRILGEKTELPQKIKGLLGFYHKYLSSQPAAAGFILRGALTKRAGKKLLAAAGAARGAYAGLLAGTLKAHSAAGEFPASRIPATQELLNAALLYYLFTGAGGAAPDNSARLPGEMARLICAGLRKEK